MKAIQEKLSTGITLISTYLRIRNSGTGSVFAHLLVEISHLVSYVSNVILIVVDRLICEQSERAVVFVSGLSLRGRPATTAF